MSFGELMLLALGLSMDACAAAVGKGLACPALHRGDGLRCGAWFGAFQAAMPVAGFWLGSVFSDAVRAADHWVILFLLTLIGANLIRESRDGTPPDGDFSPKALFLPALATSVDALAVGISLAVTDGVRILPAAAGIGAVTFCTSALGVRLGGCVGSRFGTGARIAGGLILIFLGIKIFLEHMLS